MRVHLTRAAAFGPFYHFLEAGGSSVSRRLSGMGIDPELLSAPEVLISVRQCSRFVDRSSSREGIDDIGLATGSETTIGDFGLFGMVLRQSLTLKDLIEKMITWMPLVDSAARAWLEDADKCESVRLCIAHDIDVARSEVNDYGLMLLIDAVRLATGTEWRPSAVWLDREQGLRRASRFEALSEAALHMRARASGFLIPRHLLSRPVRRRSTPKNLSANPEVSLQSTAPPDDLVGSITCAIRAGMQSRVPSLDEVADMAGTNRRGIQRGLQSKGTSFRELLDRVRYEEASRLLSNRSNHINEIAHRLGYSDLSNFSHAFTRWTGTAPSNYRKLHHNPQSD